MTRGHTSLSIPTAIIAKRILDTLQERTGTRPTWVDLREFHGLTEGLTGPERLAVFHALPEDVQAGAWDALAQVVEAQRAAEDDRPYQPRERKRLSTSDPLNYDRKAKDPLVTIPPPEYVARLGGVDVSMWGTVRCPLPGHDERTGSMKVYEAPERGWYCYGCHRGGSIFDFASATWGIPTRGAGFKELRRRLREELGVN